MAERERPNALERAVAGAGVLLTLAVVGLLGWDALRGGSAEPELRVALGAPRVEGAEVRVPVTLRNDGGQAGEDVAVEVCRGEGAAEDCAETTFPFAPRGSRREGVVTFAGGGGPFRARVTSYRLP